MVLYLGAKREAEPTTDAKEAEPTTGGRAHNGTRGCQGISDWDLIEARLQGTARRRLMRADEQEEARNGSPKLQRAGLPVCTVPSLQVDDLNCDHRDPAQVLLYLRALRRELRAAFFPGAVSGLSLIHI